MIRIFCTTSRVRVLLSVLELGEFILFAVSAEVGLELLPLLLQVLGDEVIHVAEEVINWGLLGLNANLEGFAHSLAGFVSVALGVLRLDEAALGQVLLETIDRALNLGKQVLPLLHFCIISVPLREVTSAMVTDSVRNGLNEYGPLLGDYNLSCLLASCVNGKDIISINSD